MMVPVMNSGVCQYYISVWADLPKALKTVNQVSRFLPTGSILDQFEFLVTPECDEIWGAGPIGSFGPGRHIPSHFKTKRAAAADLFSDLVNHSMNTAYRLGKLDQAGIATQADRDVMQTCIDSMVEAFKQAIK